MELVGFDAVEGGDRGKGPVSAGLPRTLTATTATKTTNDAGSVSVSGTGSGAAVHRGPDSARTLVDPASYPTSTSTSTSTSQRRKTTSLLADDAASIVTIAAPGLADLPTELLGAILDYVGGKRNRPLNGQLHSNWFSNEDTDMFMDDFEDLDEFAGLGVRSVTPRPAPVSDTVFPPGYKSFWSYPPADKQQLFANKPTATQAILYNPENRDTPSLARCLLLSRGMFNLTLPLLYSYPHLRTHSTIRDFSRAFHSRARSEIYAAHVRLMYIGVDADSVSAILLEGIISRCHNLTGIEMSGRFDGRRGDGFGTAEEPVGNGVRSTAVAAPMSPAEQHAVAFTNAYMASVKRALEEMHETASAAGGGTVAGSGGQSLSWNVGSSSGPASSQPVRPTIQPATYATNAQYFAEATAAARRAVSGVVVNLEDVRGRDSERGRGHRRGGFNSMVHQQFGQSPFASTPYFAAATLAVQARPSLEGRPIYDPAQAYHTLAISAASQGHSAVSSGPRIDSAASYYAAATAAAAAPKAPGQLPVVLASPQPMRPPPPVKKLGLFRSSSGNRQGRALSPGTSIWRPKSPPALTTATHYTHTRLGSPPPSQPFPTFAPSSGYATVNVPFASIQSLRAANALYNPTLYPSRIPHPLLKSMSVTILPPLLTQPGFRKLSFSHLTFARGASLLVKFSTGEKGVNELEFKGCLLDSRVLWRAAANSGKSLEKLVITSCRVPEADTREFGNRAWAFWEPLVQGMTPRNGTGKLRVLDLGDPLSELLKPDDRAVMHILRTLGRTLEYFVMDVGNCTRLGLVKAARWCAANLGWGGEGGTRLRGAEVRYQGSPRRYVRRDVADGNKEGGKDKELLYGSSPPKIMYGPLSMGWDAVGAGKDGDALSQLARILGEIEITEEDGRMIEALEEHDYWEYFGGVVGRIGWVVKAVGDD